MSAFTVEWNRSAAEAGVQQAHDDATLTHVQRKIDRIIEGLRTPDLKEKPEALTAQRRRWRVVRPTAGPLAVPTS